ncbi:heterokaryon incompatibility protein-domain-containing protein [Pisolithus croceorrhizus]|nr:heterokaryon incompatibility protein-domain-containing protein [Pisolithus croceorrhizus]
MRLIDVKAFLNFDEGNLELETQLLVEFDAAQLAEIAYAILSHCWGDPKDEVQYSEMIALTTMDAVARDKIRQRSGHLKIRKSCELALKDRLDWLWVDTCCIDRRSTAELSEAINSMYAWYANSDRCYAFLHDSDTSSLPTERDRRFIEFNGWPRWFSRGWTVQELVAPGNVHFFNHKWQCIGDKQGCAPALCSIAHISVDVLERGLGGTRPSVAQIMSWAANRRTAREEDRAYSMLGLLGVHMPILYGEGKNAFLRLQLEVIRTVDDQSIFAWGWTKEWGCSSSFLADDPNRFQDCSTIEKTDREKFNRILVQSLSKRVLRRFPFAKEGNRVLSVTNDGIHIRLPLRLHQHFTDSALFSATLACHDTQKGSEAITIFMEKRNSGYSRCFRAPVVVDGEGKQPVTFQSVLLPYRGSIHRKVRGPLSPRNREQARISLSEIEPDDVVIIVLGPLGSGKSNIINKLIGMLPEPNANALDPCTKTVSAYTHVRKGKRFVFIDTPALEQDKFQSVPLWLGFIYRRSTVLTGVIYTHNIAVKCTGTEGRNFRVLCKMCREGAIDRLHLVTTMWHDTSSPEALEMERVLKEEYAKFLLDTGSGYKRFDNTPELAWKIVEGLTEEMTDKGRAQAKISTTDIKPNDVVIIVLGPPGSGKSNVG